MSEEQESTTVNNNIDRLTPNVTYLGREMQEALDAEGKNRTILRDRIREHMRVARLSQAQLAPKIGLSTTTLSRWLAGDYPGDNFAVGVQVTKFLDLQTQRINNTVREVGYVGTDTSERIFKKLGHAQVLADVVMICAPPGTSKTSACLEYAKRNPRVWHVELSPSRKTVSAALALICKAMKLPVSLTPSRTSDLIIEHITGTEGLLIIDEFQHASLDVIEEIRSIYDAANIGLALVGNKGAWTQLVEGPRAEKLERMLSRVGARLELSRPSKADVLAYIGAWNIAGDCRNRLLQIGQGKGAIRTLAKTIKLAARYAAAQKVELCCEHIDAAHADMSGVE